VLREQQVLKAHKVILELKVLLEQQVHKVQLVLRVLLVQQVH